MRSVLALCSTVLAVLLIGRAGNGVMLGRFGVDQSIGKKLFQERCARCHAVSAESAGSAGPSLARIGEFAGGRKPGMNGPEYLLESILDPTAYKAPGANGEMPMRLADGWSEADLRNVIAFLCSQGGEGFDEDLQSLQIEIRSESPTNLLTLERGAIERGEEVYRGKGQCASCHGFYKGNEANLWAPAVLGAGLTSREELRRSILEPAVAVGEAYQLTDLFLSNGKVETGKIIARENSLMKLIRLVGTDRGILMDIPIGDVERDDDGKLMIYKSGLSGMPVGYADLLSKSELEDLLDFLQAAN